jgi:hypothetical protein
MCVCVCVRACVSVCLSVSLPVSLPVSLFVRLYICGHGPLIYPVLFPLVTIRFSLFVIRNCN